jgi:subtilase family serine protease
VIIDAYGDDYVANNLSAFNQVWGLPASQLTVLKPFGVDGSSDGWSFETNMDVQYAHAFAPGATIKLVVARTASDVDLYNAIRYAVDNDLGDVISMSFGGNESCMDPQVVAEQDQAFKDAIAKNITLVASSGDAGSAVYSCDGNNTLTTGANYPAANPLVTALGGTALTANADTGKYSGEAAWNESDAFLTASTGGGYSSLYPRPTYQENVTESRAFPDISLTAAVNGSSLVWNTDPRTQDVYVSIAAGTSLSAPLFAGMIANGVQLAKHRLGFVNPALYRLGKNPATALLFNDITSGSNILFASGIAGYTNTKSWDPVTGWGSPRSALTFLPTLIAAIHSDDGQNV